MELSMVVTMFQLYSMMSRRNGICAMTAGFLSRRTRMLRTLHISYSIVSKTSAEWHDYLSVSDAKQTR